MNIRDRFLFERFGASRYSRLRVYQDLQVFHERGSSFWDRFKVSMASKWKSLLEKKIKSFQPVCR